MSAAGHPHEVVDVNGTDFLPIDVSMPFVPSDAEFEASSVDELLAPGEYVPALLNRRQRRALVRSLPKSDAPIKRAMRGIKTSADAVALAKARGL